MNIFSTIAALFTMISTFIGAINKLATASDKYCSIAELHADHTYNQYNIEAKARTKQLEQQLADLENTASVSTTNP